MVVLRWVATVHDDELRRASWPQQTVINDIELRQRARDLG
ncbi:hypothetical protein SS05631_a47660 (plasmid) [Sinorhizobium sp. CCBAU 05631]|nr:hypothetical protein SS05631_a47660 [Sinorhizobium sp. CCBAU 05631]